MTDDKGCEGGMALGDNCWPKSIERIVENSKDYPKGTEEYGDNYNIWYQLAHGKNEHFETFRKSPWSFRYLYVFVYTTYYLENDCKTPDGWGYQINLALEIFEYDFKEMENDLKDLCGA